MKKILLIAIVSFLSACSDPKEIVINKGGDIEANADKLKNLSLEDRQLLAGYIIRAEMGSVFGQSNSASYGVTVQEAIEKQKQFVAEQEKQIAEKKVVEEKVRAAEEKARQEYAEKEKQLNLAVDVVFVSYLSDVNDFGSRNATVVFKIVNKSDKDITGIKGIGVFYDKFGDEIYSSGLKIDFKDINGVLAQGAEYEYTGGTRINQFIDEEVKFATSSTADLKFEYRPEVVLFKDGTSIEAKTSNQKF